MNCQQVLPLAIALVRLLELAVILPAVAFDGDAILDQRDVDPVAPAGYRADVFPARFRIGVDHRLPQHILRHPALAARRDGLSPGTQGRGGGDFQAEAPGFCQRHADHGHILPTWYETTSGVAIDEIVVSTSAQPSGATGVSRRVSIR